MMKNIISRVLLALAFAGALPAHAAGIVDKLFLQDGAGAIARTYAEKTRETVSVLDYGADKTGAADSTTAIQKAIDTCKSVLFPEGQYKITASVTNACGSRLYAQSAGGAVINVVGSGYDAFILASSFSEISGLSFTAPAARAGGAYIAISTASRSNHIEKFRMQNAFIGIHIQAEAVITRIQDGELTNTAQGVGIGILVGGGNDTFISRVVMDNPVGVQPLAGIKLKRTQATWVTDTDVIHSGTPLLIAPDGAVGDLITWCFFKSFAGDLSSGPGISIAPVNGATVKGLFFSNSWTSSNLVGASITKDAASAVDTVQFTDHTAFNNLNQGAYIQAGNNIDFKASRFAGNSQSVVNTYAGIEFGNGVQNFSVRGSRSGAIAGFPASQSVGIQIGTGANVYEVDDNNLIGNASGAMIDNSAGTSTVRKVRDNLGAKTRATGVATILAGQSEVTITHELLGSPKIVLVSPVNSNMGGLSFWTGSYSGTTFKINTSGAVASDMVFSWEATSYD